MTALCRLSEIPDGEARGFVLGEGLSRTAILVARRGDAVYGYVNSCPHTGTPLDWTPDRFMSADGKELQCATHGARFRVEDGLCTDGPCRGDRLAAVPLARDGEAVFLASSFSPPLPD